MPCSHALVRASPAVMSMAVTNDWNEPLVGARPMRPFHLGSVRLKTLAGSSAAGTLRGS